MAYYDHGAAIEAQKCEEEFGKLISWLTEFSHYQLKAPNSLHNFLGSLTHHHEEIPTNASHETNENSKQEIVLLEKLNAINVTQALRHKNKLDTEQKKRDKKLEQFENCFSAISVLLPRQSSPSDVIG